MPTLFNDLPDLCLFEIFGYLNTMNIIYSFLDVNERMNVLLREKRYLSDISVDLTNTSLNIFKSFFNSLLPTIGSNITNLTIAFNQIELTKLYHYLLPNVKSLSLLSIINPNGLQKFFESKYFDSINELKMEFNGQTLIRSYTYSRIVNRFLFTEKTCRTTFEKCTLWGSCPYGICLQNVQQTLNIKQLTIQLNLLIDLLLLFDNLPCIEQFNVKLYRIHDSNDNISIQTYDYSKLRFKLSKLVDFTLDARHILDYTLLDKILRNLLSVQKLSLTYLTYEKNGIDGIRLHDTLSPLLNLNELSLLMTITYFTLVENHLLLSLKILERYNIHCWLDKNEYILYTKRFNHTLSLILDPLINDQIKTVHYSSVKILELSNRQRFSHSSLVKCLHQFPNLTSIKLQNIINLSEKETIKYTVDNVLSLAYYINVKYFQQFLFILPYLTTLKINYTCLQKYLTNSKYIFNNFNHIYHLKIIKCEYTNLNEILTYFSMLNTLSLQMSFYRKDYHTQKCLYFELIHSTILTRMKNLYYFEFIYDWEDLIQYLYSKLSSSTDNQIIQLHGDMITIWK